MIRVKIILLMLNQNLHSSHCPKKRIVSTQLNLPNENHGNLDTKNTSGFEKLWAVRKGISFSINIRIIKAMEIHPIPFKEFS